MLINGVPEPIKGVIFDFHATLVAGGDAGRWIDAALRHLTENGGARPDLSADQLIGLREHLDQVWQHATPMTPEASVI